MVPTVDELVIPSQAKEDPESFEIARVWIAMKNQHCTLKVGVWDDPTAWGILLADLARHVARAYHQDKGLDEEETLIRIQEGVAAEFDSPTDTPSGSIA